MSEKGIDDMSESNGAEEAEHNVMQLLEHPEEVRARARVRVCVCVCVCTTHAHPACSAGLTGAGSLT